MILYRAQGIMKMKEMIDLVLKGIRGDKVTTENSVKFFIAKGKYIHETLSEITQQKVTIGVGQYYPQIKGLKKSFQDAKLALEIGSKIWGTGGVYHILDVGIFVSLSPISHQRKAELAIQLLKPLFENEELSKTVESFLSSGMNLTEAANKLHVHRNTLIYRLDKVNQVIGLDPRTFQGALQIKLGFMLSSLK
jgi:carbohydrate diacid regulator